MKKIEIIKENDCLVLKYYPNGGTQFIKERFENGESIISIIRGNLLVSSSEIIEIDDEYVDIIIARLEGQYYRINGDMFLLNNDVYFNKDIQFSAEMFISSFAGVRDSVLLNIDRVINCEIYIESDYNMCSSENHIPVNVYVELLKLFPKQYEIQKYIAYRINYILEEYLSGAEKYVEAFKHYVRNKNKRIQELRLSSGSSVISEFNELMKVKKETLYTVKEWLENALNNVDNISEDDFQKQILIVILAIFPKYLTAVREVRIKGMDKNDKIPDFLLIDASGIVDVLEIKKPDKFVLRTMKYRNNFTPTRELAGAAVQVEKYINCLQRNADEFERDTPEKVRANIPEGFKVRVINPRGIVLMGRSDGFDDQQIQDFEIIRRHYLHIADIITYDDLLERIDNVIKNTDDFNTKI